MRFWSAGLRWTTRIAGVAASGILAVMACRDVSAPPQARSASSFAKHQIVDAAHNGGTPHFYFLPPMVQMPSVSGTFDGTLSPTVEVCALAGTVCSQPPIATYTTTTGVGGQTVRVSQTDGSYQVNWDTKAMSLDLSTTYRITVRVLSTELGHCDIKLVSNGSAAKNAQTGDDIVLVDGRTMPVKFRVEQGAVAVIGANGGVAHLDDGQVTLTIPNGALNAPAAITATPIAAGTGDDASVLGGTQFEFQPSPMSFGAPVTLTVKYPATLPSRIKASRLDICKMIDRACVPLTGGTVNLSEHTVTAQISTFSEYGISPFPELLYQDPSDGSWWLHTAAGEVLFPSTISYFFDGPNADWSPDGQTVAYTATVSGVDMVGNDSDTPLHIIGADATNDHVIAPSVRCRPHWSPDGTRILTGSANGPIVMDATGTVLATFTTNSLWSGQPGWTIVQCSQAWGTSVGQITFRAYQTQVNGVTDPSGFWSVNIDGSGLRMLVRTDGGVGVGAGAAKSADGSYLAFSGGFANDLIGSGVYVMAADGSNLHLVLPWGLQFTWSPIPAVNTLMVNAGADPYVGSLLDACFFHQALMDGIYSADVGGSQLTPFFVADCASPYAFAKNPQWSPDGSRASVEVPLSDHSELYLQNLDGTGLQSLLGPGKPSVNALWRP